MAVVDSGRKTSSGATIWKAAPTSSSSSSSSRSSGGKTREQMVEEQRQKLLGGVAQDDTKSGRFLRGETVQATTGKVSLANTNELGTQTGSLLSEAPQQAPPQSANLNIDDTADPALQNAATEREQLEVLAAENPAAMTPEQSARLGELRRQDLSLDPQGLLKFAQEAPGAMGAMMGGIGGWFDGGSTQNVLGTLTTSKGGISNVQINTKNMGLMKGMFQKGMLAWKNAKTGTKASVVVLGIVSTWAASTGFGLWGTGEGPENIGFPVGKFLMPQAMVDGNWTNVNDALDMAEEITYENQSTWERFLQWSGLGTIIGSMNKVKGSTGQIAIMRQFAKDEEQRQKDGLTESDMYKKNQEDRVRDEVWLKDVQRVLSEQRDADRIKTEAELIRLREDASIRSDDRRITNLKREIRMWDARDAEQRRLDELDRIAQMEFWLAYDKLKAKMYAENRPSKLNFGIV